jgi:hypothetical protein
VLFVAAGFGVFVALPPPQAARIALAAAAAVPSRKRRLLCRCVPKALSLTVTPPHSFST